MSHHTVAPYPDDSHGGVHGQAPAVAAALPQYTYAHPYPPAGYPQPPAAGVANTYLEQGKFGAVVGLCGGAAVNLHRLQQGEIGTGQALLSTLHTGVASGLATATAGLVGAQFRNALVSLAAALAAGTAVMYVLTTEASDKVPGEQS